jgi:hypothetical protein
MEFQQFAYLLFSSIIRQLPQFIVLMIGLFLCFSNRTKYPKASRMSLGGLFILLASQILGTAFFIFQVYLPLWYRDSFEKVGYISFAVGLGLIIYAVWAERDDRFVKS